MIITRWQAAMVPEVQQIKNIFQAEELIPYEDQISGKTETSVLRLPFDEVRMVARGEMLLNISGNKMLLRSGDKVIIPANTKHSMKVDNEQGCLCVCAKRIF